MYTQSFLLPNLNRDFYAKSTKRAAAPEELGIDNIVTLAVDAISVSRVLGTTFGDGLQFTDGFTIIQQYPVLLEIGRVAKPAFKEIRNLSPEESAEAAAKISELTGLPNDKTLWGKVRLSLGLAARTYKWVDSGKALAHEWKDVFVASAL